MPVWALVLLIVVLVLLLAPGIFVKSLSFLIYVAVALLVIYLIVWLVRALAGNRRV